MSIKILKFYTFPKQISGYAPVPCGKNVK